MDSNNPNFKRDFATVTYGFDIIYRMPSKAQKKQQQRRLRLIVSMYLLSGCFALIGLHFGIQTQSINHKMNLIKKDMRKMKRENESLEYAVLNETRLEKIDNIARNQLNMIPPKKIHYITPKNP